MRDYGTVYSSFWSNPDIQSLSDDGKLLALYLLAGPHTTALGCFRVPDGYICSDLNWNSHERVSEGLDELFKIGFAHRCRTTSWVLLPNYLKWNPIENPNQGKYLAKLIAQVPHSCTLLPELTLALQRFGSKIPEQAIAQLQRFSETLSEGLSNPLPNRSLTTNPNPNIKEEKLRQQGELVDPRLGANGTDPSPKPNGLPPCPHKAILTAWAEIMPEQHQPRAALWKPRRADYKHLAARWKEGFALRKAETGEPYYTDTETGIGWWRRYFLYLRDSKFLMREFRGGISLPWIIKAENFVKTLEGKYHDAG